MEKIIVNGCILSAGLSSRMKALKALLEYKGTTFIQNIIDDLSELELNEIIIITGYKSSKIENSCAEKNIPLKFCYNKDYEKDQFVSVQCAIKNSLNSSAVLINLVDHPAVDQSVYKIVFEKGLENIKQGEPKVIIPVFNNRGGHPVFIPNFFYDKILKDNGEDGLRGVFKKHPENIERIETSVSILYDIDTPDDYKKLVDNNIN